MKNVMTTKHFILKDESAGIALRSRLGDYGAYVDTITVPNQAVSVGDLLTKIEERNVYHKPLKYIYDNVLYGLRPLSLQFLGADLEGSVAVSVPDDLRNTAWLRAFLKDSKSNPFISNHVQYWNQLFIVRDWYFALLPFQNLSISSLSFVDTFHRQAESLIQQENMAAIKKLLSPSLGLPDKEDFTLQELINHLVLSYADYYHSSHPVITTTNTTTCMEEKADQDHQSNNAKDAIYTLYLQSSYHTRMIAYYHSQVHFQYHSLINILQSSLGCFLFYTFLMNHYSTSHSSSTSSGVDIKKADRYLLLTIQYYSQQSSSDSSLTASEREYYLSLYQQLVLKLTVMLLQKDLFHKFYESIEYALYIYQQKHYQYQCLENRDCYLLPSLRLLLKADTFSKHLSIHYYNNNAHHHQQQLPLLQQPRPSCTTTPALSASSSSSSLVGAVAEEGEGEAKRARRIAPSCSSYTSSCYFDAIGAMGDEEDGCLYVVEEQKDQKNDHTDEEEEEKNGENIVRQRVEIKSSLENDVIQLQFLIHPNPDDNDDMNGEYNKGKEETSSRDEYRYELLSHNLSDSVASHHRLIQNFPLFAPLLVPQILSLTMNRENENRKEDDEEDSALISNFVVSVGAHKDVYQNLYYGCSMQHMSSIVVAMLPPLIDTVQSVTEEEEEDREKLQEVINKTEEAIASVIRLTSSNDNHCIIEEEGRETKESMMHNKLLQISTEREELEQEEEEEEEDGGRSSLTLISSTVATVDEDEAAMFATGYLLTPDDDDDNEEVEDYEIEHVRSSTVSTTRDRRSFSFAAMESLVSGYHAVSSATSFASKAATNVASSLSSNLPTAFGQMMIVPETLKQSARSLSGTFAAVTGGGNIAISPTFNVVAVGSVDYDNNIESVRDAVSSAAIVLHTSDGDGAITMPTSSVTTTTTETRESTSILSRNSAQADQQEDYVANLLPLPNDSVDSNVGIRKQVIKVDCILTKQAYFLTLRNHLLLLSTLQRDEKAKEKALSSYFPLLVSVDASAPSSVEFMYNLLYELFTPSTLHLLLWAYLLEMQILIVTPHRCQDLSIVLVIGRWLAEAISPLIWPHTFGPNLPLPSILALIACPTPFLLGIRSDDYQAHEMMIHEEKSKRLLTIFLEDNTVLWSHDCSVNHSHGSSNCKEVEVLKQMYDTNLHEGINNKKRNTDAYGLLDALYQDMKPLSYSLSSTHQQVKKKNERAVKVKMNSLSNNHALLSAENIPIACLDYSNSNHSTACKAEKVDDEDEEDDAIKLVQSFIGQLLCHTEYCSFRVEYQDYHHGSNMAIDSVSQAASLNKVESKEASLLEKEFNEEGDVRVDGEECSSIYSSNSANFLSVTVRTKEEAVLCFDDQLFLKLKEYQSVKTIENESSGHHEMLLLLTTRYLPLIKIFSRTQSFSTYILSFKK